MLVYDFRPQFAGDVKSGKKNKTIRKDRKEKRLAVVGERLILRAGPSELLGVGICTEVVSIVIKRDCAGRSVAFYAGDLLGFVRLHDHQIEDFAISDGFKSADEFFDFFNPPGHDEFIGHLIKWDLIRSGKGNAA